MLCKICGCLSSVWSKTRILNKFTVQYYCCEHGFIRDARARLVLARKNQMSD